MTLQAISSRLLSILGLLNDMDTKRKRLYDTAFAMIGHDASPKDYAPDDYGCAEVHLFGDPQSLPRTEFPYPALDPAALRLSGRIDRV